MKKTIIFLLICIATFLFSNETEKRIIIDKDHQHYGIIEYIDDFYDNNNLVRSELVFTEQYTKKNGRINQIEYFDNNGNTVKYDSMFNNDYEAYWGVNRVIEYLQNKNYEKIVYQFYNGSKYVFENSDMNTINSHGIVYLSSMIKDYKKDTNLSTLTILSGQRISTCVDIIHKSKFKANQEELDYIGEWLKGLGKENTSKKFETTIMVKENETKYKFFVLDEIFNNIYKLDECVLYAIYLGTLNNVPMTIVVGYNDFKLKD